MIVASGAAPVTHTAHFVEAIGFMIVSLVAVALIDARASRPDKPSRTPKTPARPAFLVLAGAGALSAGIHFSVAPEHWREDPLYGSFFLVVASAQLIGMLLILWRPGRALITANAVGNASLVLLWLVTRTVGIPLGTERGEVESMGALDVLSTAAECASVLCAVLLLRAAASAAWPHSRGRVAMTHPGHAG